MLAMQDRVWRRDHGAVLSGVCVGLAEDLDLPLPMVRIVTVLFLLLPTGLAYLALSMLLRRGPVRRSTSPSPIRMRTREPMARAGLKKETASKEWALLQHRFAGLEPRLKRIEAFVTSSEFELDRGFRRMEE